MLKKYFAYIRYDYGRKEVKVFTSIKDREDFLEKNSEVIESCVYGNCPECWSGPKYHRMHGDISSKKILEWTRCLVCQCVFDDKITDK